MERNLLLKIKGQKGRVDALSFRISREEVWAVDRETDDERLVNNGFAYIAAGMADGDHACEGGCGQVALKWEPFFRGEYICEYCGHVRSIDRDTDLWLVVDAP